VVAAAPVGFVAGLAWLDRRPLGFFVLGGGLEIRE